MDLPYKISKPATLENMETIITFVQDIGSDLQMDSGLAHKLHLVLEEILVNIIKYAYSDPSKQGTISIYCGMPAEDNFCVQIRDQGLAFNPLQSEDPDLDEDMQARPIGGLGIFLVKKIADYVEYNRENQANILTICFKRQNA